MTKSNQFSIEDSSAFRLARERSKLWKWSVYKGSTLIAKGLSKAAALRHSDLTLIPEMP